MSGGDAARRPPPTDSVLNQRLESLPLRSRFLVVPLLGLLLIASLTLVFVVESRRQSALLGEITDQRLAQLNHFSALFHRLSAEHSRIFDLLSAGASGNLDEEALYERSQEHLDAIRGASEDLQEALAGADDLSGRPVRRALAEAAVRYRQAAATALELGTVDLQVAERELVEANHHFVNLSARFTDLLEEERHDIGAALDTVAARSWAMALWVGATGLSLSAFLLLMSIVLSRLLARSLEHQLDALTELGREAGAVIASRASDEIAAIGGAIGAFRTSLRQLRQREHELSEANEALTRARDELEMRVEERTRELREANAGLSAEIERRRQAERHLRVYAEVIQATGEAVVITDAEGIIFEVNPAYERVTGYRRREVIGKSLKRGIRSVTSEGTLDEIEHALETRGAWSGELAGRRKGGDVYPAWVTINVVPGEDGSIRNVVSVSRDISDLKESELQLQKLAFYDTLTGLPNRALFSDRLRMALAMAQRKRSRFAIMYLDLDRFKYVNDTLGHAAGDELLIEVSKRLSRHLRASDTIARIGGDEYTVLLNEISADDDARIVAERLIDEISRPAEIHDRTVFVGLSVGISFYPRDSEDPDELRKYADLALYDAKQAGRGQYRIFEPEMLIRSQEKLTLTVRLDAAIENDELILLYQPIVDADRGVATALEALVRWRQPDGTLLPPGAFLGHAEETGLIKRVDLWVLARACRDRAAWAGELDPALRVSVNISAASLQQQSLPDQLAEILERSGLPPSQLDLEVSETSVVVQPRMVASVLHRISDLGVDVSMDDFGTVYSSLNHLLTQFPIRRIKLGRSFVERIGKDVASERLIEALMQLTHRLHIDVVAIGVEAGDQSRFLRTAGCQLLQGYHFGEPLPPEEVLGWVSRSAQATET